MFDDLYLSAKLRWERFLKDENGISGIVVAVLLIIVAVVLAFTFREQAKELMESWFKQAGEDVTNNLQFEE